MKKWPLFALIAIVIGLAGTFAVYASTTPQTRSEAATVSKYDQGPPDAQEMLELVNAERAKYGVAPLVIDAMLSKSAQWKADDMANNNYFGHTQPNQTAKNGLDYLNSIDTEGKCMYVSENINKSEGSHEELTSRATFNSWLGSETHREAMLDSRYTATGLAIAGGGSQYYEVEHFCIAK